LQRSFHGQEKYRDSLLLEDKLQRASIGARLFGHSGVVAPGRIWLFARWKSHKWAVRGLLLQPAMAMDAAWFEAMGVSAPFSLAMPGRGC
jgi:hypothetical protein